LRLAGTRRARTRERWYRGQSVPRSPHYWPEGLLDPARARSGSGSANSAKILSARARIAEIPVPCVAWNGTWRWARAGKNGQGWQHVQLVGERRAEHQPDRLAVERHNDFDISAMTSVRAHAHCPRPSGGSSRHQDRYRPRGRSTDGGKTDAYRGRLPVLAGRLKRRLMRAQRFAFPRQTPT